MQNEIKTLKKWLAIRGNSMAVLASSLGYASSSVVDQWIRRNSIPNYQIQRVMEIVNGKPTKSSNERKNKKAGASSNVRN